MYSTGISLSILIKFTFRKVHLGMLLHEPGKIQQNSAIQFDK